MTIKKIMLSVAAATMVATTAFAGTMSEGGSLIKYNTNFISTQSAKDIGKVIKNVELNTTSAINAQNVLNFKLSGANWAGKTINYQISYNGGKTTVNASNKTNNELQFIISKTIAADTNVTLSYNNNNNNDLNVTLPSTSTGNVVLTTSARDNVNNIDIIGAKASLTVAKPVTSTPTATVTCPKVLINSKDKSEFVANATAPAVTKTTANCSIKILPPSKTGTAGYDFNYGDVNATVYMYPGNFTDGNITVATDNGTLGASSATGQSINYYAGDSNLTNDINSTLTYKLSGTNSLSDTTFQTKVVLGYPGDKTSSGVAPTQTVFPKANTMTWTLPVFSVTVLNMRSNIAHGVNTYIKLFNDDTTKAANVNVTVTTANGKQLPVLTNFTTVPAGGSTTISASAIKAAVADPAALANGYKVNIGYTNVVNTLGNAVAIQRRLNSTWSIRVKTNRKVNSNVYYQGL